MDFPLAETVTPRLEIVEQTGSTNADLTSRVGDLQGWPHLSVLVTADQTAGRGRLDRTWVAPAGASLAISVLLRDLPAPGVRGWIPLAAGAAMAGAVAAQLPGRAVGVKWPNDVLVEGRKICGILAEAASDAVVIGAGVNTAMSTDQLPVPTATSFAALDAEVDADRLLTDYLRALEAYLSALAAAGDAGASGLHAIVAERCVTLGQEVAVSLPGGGVLRGSAVRLDPEGRLVVAVAGVERPVSAGDVVHVRPVGL